MFIIVINLILCFSFDALTEMKALMRTEFLCFPVLRVSSGPRVKMAGRKSVYTPVVYSADHPMAVVPPLVSLFVALWFILRGDFYYYYFFILSCVNLFLCFSILLALRLPLLGKRELVLVLCFSVLLALRLPRLGKRELVLVFFVHLFDLRLFGFVCFLFILMSGKIYGL